MKTEIKKLFILLFLMSCLLTFSFLFQNKTTLVFANENTFTATIENLNKNTEYSFIDTPTCITANSEVDFFVTDKNNNIFRYKAKEELMLASSSFKNLVDMCWFNDSLYILTETTLVKYAPTTNSTSTLLDSQILKPKALTINNDGCFIANQNNILFLDFREPSNALSLTTFELNSISYDFSNIIDISIMENKTIAMIHNSDLNTSGKNYIIFSMLSLNQSFDSIVHISSSIISTSSNIEIKIESISNEILISCEDKLYLLNPENLITSDIFSTTPLITPMFSQLGFKSGEIHTISDFCVNGDNVLICDSVSNSVQSFSFLNNSIRFKKLLIASSGADNDRLYNPSELSLNQNKNLLILDSGNHRIIQKDLKTGESTSIIDIVSPELMAVNSLGNIYVISKNSGKQILNIFDNNLGTKTTLDIANYQISDIEISTSNNVYFLDKNSKKILMLDQNNEIKEIISLNSLELDTSAKIKINAIGNQIFLLADNNIYSINLTQSNPTCDNKISILTGNVLDFYIDYQNYIYLLINESGNHKIDKYSTSSIKQGTSTLPVSNYSNLYFNLIDGEIYSINKIYNKIEVINIESFANTLKDFTNDLSFRTTPPTNGATIAKLNANCQSFKHPFSIEPLINLNQDDLVIVLNKSAKENPSFAYVMICNKENMNILAYVDNKLLEYDDIEDTPLEFNKIKINVPKAYVYYFPTGLKFEDNQMACRYPESAKKGETYEVIGFAYGFTDYSETNFYEILLENGNVGYIKAPFAHNAEEDKPIISLQSDARVEKVLNSDVIYVYNFNELINGYEKTQITLNHGQLIQIIGEYDATAEFTQIKFLDPESSTLKTGYVQSKFVVYDDITNLKIVGIVILILGIILLIIAIIIISNHIKRQSIAKTDYEKNIPSNE